MNNPDDPSGLSLDAAITAYLRSEYFTGLSSITKSKRRGVLRNMRADVLHLLGLPETPPPHPVLPPARSVPWLTPLVTQNKPAEGLSEARQPARRRNWTTA